MGKRVNLNPFLAEKLELRIITRFLRHFTLILILIGSQLGQAGNEHEHLQYVPSYQDFVDSGYTPAEIQASEALRGGASFRLIFGKDLSYRLLATTPYFRRFQLNKKGISEQDLNQKIDLALKQYLKKKSLGEVAEALSQMTQDREKFSKDQVLQAFFELNEVQGHLSSDRAIEAYSKIGVLRYDVLIKKKENLPKLFSTYLKRESSSTWRGCAISIPMSLYSKEVLQPLGEVFRHHGVQCDFLLSIDRLRKTNDDRFLEETALIRSSLSEGWGHGVDIVGSIKEHKKPYQAPGTDIKTDDDQLRTSIENLLTSHIEILGTQGSFRVHAFESAREGPFYQSFWKVMEALPQKEKLPKTILIGHINSLKKRDINRFKVIQDQLKSRTEFIFNANIESNLQLQSSTRSASLEKLSQTVYNLQQARFKVLIGSDGQGILGPSSVWEAVFGTLKTSGIGSPSLLKLVNDSQLILEEKNRIIHDFELTPKTGHTFSPSSRH